MMPPMRESTFWSQVKAKLVDDETHLCRLENSSGSGMPDVNGCRRGAERWIELKMFHGQRLHFRASQRSWMLSRKKVGGKVWVLARKDDEIFLWAAWHLLESPSKVEKEGKSFSIKYDDMPGAYFRDSKPFAWDKLRDAIFGQ